MKTLLVIMLVISALSLGTLLLLQRESRAEAVSGQVFVVPNPDALPADWTPAPLGGAHVIVFWRGALQNNPVDSASICLRALRLVSSNDGTFSAPAWKAELRWPIVTNIEGVAYVVETGYSSVRDRLRGQESWMTAERGLYVSHRSLPPDVDSLQYLAREASRCELKQ